MRAEGLHCPPCSAYGHIIISTSIPLQNVTYWTTELGGGRLTWSLVASLSLFLFRWTQLPKRATGSPFCHSLRFNRLLPSLINFWGIVGMHYWALSKFPSVIIFPVTVPSLFCHLQNRPVLPTYSTTPFPITFPTIFSLPWSAPLVGKSI